MKRFFPILKPSAWCLLVGLAAGDVHAQELSLTRLVGSWLQNANNSLSATGSYYRPRGLATATATAIINAGQVTGFTISSAGAGYGAPPQVTLTGGGGTGASAVAVLGPSGGVIAIHVVNGGSGYASAPTVALSAPLLGGTGSTAIFNTDISADRQLTVDGNYIYGRMILGDLSSSQVYSFEVGTGGRFTIDNGGYAGGHAFLNKFQGGADLIKVPMTLNSDWVARVQSSRITVSGTISGSGTILSTGAGVLAITGDNTGTGVDLVLWNRGGTGTGAQVELGATVGNAVSGNITIGNTLRGTTGHAVLQLLQGRSNLDQIYDGATLVFDSMNGVSRNAYFKLMGGNETVGRILDLGDRAIIENREAETVNTSSVLTIGGNTPAGNLDSRINGYIRDSSGTNIQQGDSNAKLGSGVTSRLGITKEGTGDLRMVGANIIYSGETRIENGSLTLQNTTNFRSNIVNNSQLNFNVTTGTVNMRKVFPTIPGSNPAKTYADEFLSVSGSGSINKTGAGVLGIFGTQTIGGDFTMDNGTLNLNAGSGGISIGGALVGMGDVGLNRNINLSGVVNIGEGIEFGGRFNNVGSLLTIGGATLGYGDQEAATWTDTVVNVNGSIQLHHGSLVLQSNFEIPKTTSGGTSNSRNVTVTNSSDLVVGMRVSGSGVPANTTITEIDPVRRVITLSNNASIPASTQLTFRYSTDTDGRLTGNISDITLSGRVNIVGNATDSSARLVLSNTQFSNNTNRIPDNTPIVSHGGVMEFVNNAGAANFSETVGNLVLEHGSFQVIGYRAASGRTSTLTFAGLERNPGSILEFGGRNLSSGTAVLDTANLGVDARNRILFTSAPTLTNGILGGWAYANNEWVTYGANGVTPLTSYHTNESANHYTEWTSAINAKMSVTQTFSTAGERTVNSLNIQPSTSVAATGRTLNLSASPLYILSGGLLSSHGNHTISAGTGFLTAGTATPGDRELFTIVGNTANSTTLNILTVTAPIRDFVISRNISAANAGVSTLTLATGFTNKDIAVGMEVSGPAVQPGTTVTAISGNVITLSKPITAQMSANTAITFGSHQSVSLVKGGAGTLRLENDDNSYTGRTTIANGTLMIGIQGALGETPTSFVADQIRLDGGFLQFGRRTSGTGLTADALRQSDGYAPDKIYEFTDGNTGFTIGSAGGRFEVGIANPDVVINAANNTAEPRISVTITNPIHAEGLLELAVRGVPSTSRYNTLTLGDENSTNSYLGGLKTEGSFEGMITVNGNNTIGGMLIEGGITQITGNNDFTSGIRMTTGTLILSGSNTYNGEQTFPTITLPGGTLRLEHPEALGTGGLSLALGGSGQVELRGHNQTIREISSNATSAAIITNSAPTAATATFDLDYNQTYGGQLTNGGGGGQLNLTKTGPGRLLLTNNQSSFSGVIRIEEGIIDVRTMGLSGVSSSLGTGGNGAASQLVLNGGVLSFSPVVALQTNRSFTLGAGSDAGTLVANGSNRAARVVIGMELDSLLSEKVGFEGSGPRTLTLGGINVGLNTFALQLGDAAVGESTALMKIGSGVWLLGAASNYTGQTTVVDGTLRIEANYAAGTSSIPTTASAATDRLIGNLPNGTKVSLPQFKGSTLPGGLVAGQRYYVVGASYFNQGTGAGGTALPAGAVNAVAVQADGKIVFGGGHTSYNGVTSNRITRLSSEGLLDASFATGTGAVINPVYAVASQPDGKVIIGGDFTIYNGVTRNRIVRINNNGSVDEGFNVGTGASSTVRAIVIHGDKVLIAGNFTSYNGATANRVACLNSNGILDTSFNLGGTGASGVVNGMAVQPDGKILIVGDFTSYNGITRNRVARLNSDGTLDTSFNSEGTGAGTVVNGVAVQPDGKILIVGNFTSYNGTTRNRVARLNSDGTLDTSFNPGTGAGAVVNAVVVQDDGKVIIGGDFVSVNGVARVRVARLNTDGSVDTSYGSTVGASAVVNALALQSDGKLIIGGSFASYNGLPRNRIARLSKDGQRLDESGSFQLALTPGGPPIDLTSDGVNVSYVPDIQEVAATTANIADSTFTGNLPNGTPVSFGLRAVWDPGVGGALQAASFPQANGGNINHTSVYYVVNSTGSTFQIARTPGGAPIVLTTPGANLVYTAGVAGNTSEGIFVMGGRIDIGNVDYTAPETIILQGGGIGVPRGLQASWAGNIDVQANSSWTINAGSTLTVTGNLLGNRTITQVGEGTVVLKGESIDYVVPDAPTSTMDNNRRGYTLQAGTLILDYTTNNNSKLTDNATFVMGGGRRGGILRLVGGSHKEIVSTLSLQAGASRIYRDGGTSLIRVNNIARQTGSSLYFDQEYIAEVDNANLNGILGGWAIIRDARQDAYAVIPGTVSRPVTIDLDIEALKTPLNMQGHKLIPGVPVRFTTTGELPDGLELNTTYYVIESIDARTFRVSATPFGDAVRISSAGSGVHTVETYGTMRRQSEASLVFTADPRTKAGSAGNNTIRVRIVYTPGFDPISIQFSGLGTTVSPFSYTIFTSDLASSAVEIAEALSIHPAAASILKVAVSDPADYNPDTGSYPTPPAYISLNGGDNDTGRQALFWARNGNTTPGVTTDGAVEIFRDFQTNTWSSGFHTDVVNSGLPLNIIDGASTYTLRFANALAATINLQGTLGHTLETGAILVSPTVGRNDSILTGTSTLTTQNEGNLQNFLIHQYNELGDLVLNIPLKDRASFNRSGYLSAPDTAGSMQIRRITGLIGVDGTGDTSQLSVGMTVTGTGAPAGATIVAIPDNRTVIISADFTAGTNNANNNTRNIYTFDGSIQMRGSIRQVGQNRITGVVNADGMLATSDLYIGMPISGPGIPANYRVQTIVNESDITIGTANANGITVDSANHVFNGMKVDLTFSSSIGLEKLGPGTLVVGGDSTYTGITYLVDGALRASKLTDGGVPGSLGASSNANGNLTFNGGILQYVGPTTSSNRGLTLFDYAEINIGHELTTAVFSGNITGADIFAKSGSGTLEMRGNAGLAEIRVLEGRLRIQGTDLNNAPATFTLNNFGQTGLGELRLSGGAFELRGTPEGNTTLTLGGQLYVDAGASEVRAVGVRGYNPNNLNDGAIARTTQLSLMGAEELNPVERSVAGSVLFIEEPLVGGAIANILLNVDADSRSRILPWAVYQDTTNIAQPGVNNFAAVSSTTGAVVSADSQSQYSIGDGAANVVNWANNYANVNPSEGGMVEVIISSGVTATAGSNVLEVADFQSFSFSRLMVDMRVSGPGIPSNTKIVALLTSPLRIVLSENALSSTEPNTTYTFLRPRAYHGSLAANSAINTLRYFTPVDSVIDVPEGRTLQLMSGAILVSTNVRGGAKSILGEGSLSGAVGSDASDILIHNYNPVAPFTIGARVTDNVLRIVNAGSLTAGSNAMRVLNAGISTLASLRPGMSVSGPGLQVGTTISTIDRSNQRIYLSAAALSTQTAQTYTFTAATSFVQTGTGTTVLAGNNDYTGTTYVHGGVLRLDSANAVPGGIGAVGGTSNLLVKGGVIGLGHGDFERAGGSGIAQVQFQGSGGFAAYGADRTVNIGGRAVPDVLRYGNNGFVPEGSSFLLGAVDATHKTLVINPIDLGSFSQAVRVIDGPAEIEGELAGGLIGIGKLIKFGTGSLRLSGSSRHSGGIEIAAGRLVVADVPDALGVGDGPILLGVDLTNTAKNAVIELEVEGGTLNKNLKVGDVNSRGADWVTRGSVDTSGAQVGSHASVALVNNHPAIAYYDATEGDLKYVRAADPRGTSWLPPVTVASRGDVGQHPSLAIVNGNPAISYYDATNKMLMFVRSTDISGVFWSNPVVVDSSPVAAVAVQSNGSVIIGGAFVEFDGQVRQSLARINADGSLDGSFAPQFNGSVTALAIQNDGKILVAGSFTSVNGTTRNRLARLNADGSLDSYNPNVNNTVLGLFIEPSDRVVIWGSFTSVAGTTRNRIARLNGDGTLDTSFTNANANNDVLAVVRQDDGSYVLGGTFTSVGSTTRNRIARVTSTGALDAGYDPNMNNTVSALMLQPDGKVFVGGLFTTITNAAGAGSSRRRDRLARLNTNGSLDESFYLDADAEVRGFLRQADGKVLVYGSFTRIGITPRFNFARVNTDDTLDTEFDPAANDAVLSVAQAANGQLLVGGGFSNIGGGTRHFVARLNLDGQGDAAFSRQTFDRGRYSSLTEVRHSAVANAGELRPAIAYYDVAGGLLRFTRAVDINGAGWEPSIIVDSSADVGSALSLAMVNIGGDVITKSSNNTVTISGLAINGTPAIAYYDATNGDLKYVLSNDPAGTDWSAPVVVHSTGDAGSHLDLTVVDGRPAIAYHVAGVGLHYVRASTPGGIVATNLRDGNGNITTIAVNLLNYAGSWGTPVLVDAGSVGTYPSLEVVTDGTSNQGRPAIAYYDSGALDLKYVRALNTTGSTWETPRTVVSAGDVGRSAGMVLTDGVPGIAYHDATEGDLKFLHLADATGYSRITLGDGTDWQGGVTIDGDLFFNVGNDALATISGLIEGAGGIKVAGTGTLRLTHENNQFGATLPGPAAAINSAVIIRSGTLALAANGAIGSATVELGDALPQILTVDRATTFASLTAKSGRFDADHNGYFDNAGGPGAFVEVDTTIDGYTYRPETLPDAPVFILVKDERDNPQWNGVYQIIFNADLQPDGTMNLVRVAAMDTAAELAYGTQVRVTNGTHAGQSFFIASQVDEINASAVHWQRDVADASAALLADVAGLNISNAIDINGNPLSIGDGSRGVLGGTAALTTGSVQFSGNILLQNRVAGVREARNVDLQSYTQSGYGVRFTGVIAESDSGAGNNQDRLSLRKTGTGIVTLTAANTFRGGVTVDEGTLLVMNSSGSATGAGNVTVNAGAVLGGTGIIGGSVSLTGADGIKAILRPGDPTTTAQLETLTINAALTVGADAVVEFAAGANTLTRLAANSVSLTGTGRFLLTLLDDYVPAVNEPLQLVSGSINLPAGANLRNHLVLPGNLLWDTSTFLNDGTVRVLGFTVPVQIATPPAITTPAGGGSVNPGSNVTVTFTATVSGSPEFRYQWQKSPVGMNTWTNVGAPVFTNSSTATLTLTSIFEADEAEYRLVAANGSIYIEDANTYTAVSAPVTLVVNDPPTITQQPASVTVNPGDTATLSVTAAGPGPIYYQWRRGTTNLTPPTEGLSSYQIANVQKSHEGANYNVLVSNGASAVSGPTQSNFFSLTVRDPVVVTNFPAVTGVAEGDPIILSLGHGGSGTPDLPNPGDPAFTYTWERDSGSGYALIPGAPNAAQITLPAATPGDHGTLIRVTVANSFSSVQAVTSIAVVNPSVRSQPQSRTVIAGSAFTLEVEAGGSAEGRSYQWKRGKSNLKEGAGISGVNSPVLQFEAIDLKQAGDYICEISNVHGATLSEPAFITVVAAPGTIVPVQTGKKITFTLSYAAPKGVPVQLKWQKDGVDLPVDLRYSADNLAKFTISKTTDDDSGVYTCRVTSRGPAPAFSETVDGGNFELRVFSEGPALALQPFPPAMVGAWFEYQIEADPDPARAPTTYSAKPLPAGLKLDSKTGRITGIPKAAVENLQVVIGVGNVYNKLVTETLPLTVQAVPAQAVGVFAGWIPRHAQANDYMGGRIDFTTTTAGALSGKLQLGATSYSFKGSLDLDPSGVVLPETVVSIPRKGKPVPPPITLTLRINTAQNRLAAGSKIELDGIELDISGTTWRNSWNALTNPAVTTTDGYHTVALLPPGHPSPAAAIPQGSGYAGFTVAGDGRLTVAGRTADGQTIANAAFLGPNGQIVIFQPLYKTKPRGSLLGNLTLSRNLAAEPSDNKVDGSLTWNCPANPTKNYLYPEGFGNAGNDPVVVTAIGGHYAPPEAASEANPTPKVLLGLTPGNDNAMLIFTHGGVETSETNPNLDGPTSDPSTGMRGWVSVLTGSKIVVPKGLEANPGTTSLKVVAKTGVFSGKFTLVDEKGDMSLKFDKRATNFAGILVDEDQGALNAAQIGIGHFLLRQHPNDFPADPSLTLKTTPIRSGEVVFEKRDEAPPP